jgi:hypothetical protein
MYGNELSNNILKEYSNIQKRKDLRNTLYEKDKDLELIKNKLDKKIILLNKMQENGNKSKEEISEISRLINDIEDLKIYIFKLENIILDQASELEILRDNKDKTLDNEAKINKKDVEKLTTHIPEKIKLTEISNNGEIINDSMKMFDILSKPIFKVEVKDN